MGADGSLIFDTKIDTSGFSAGAGKLGSIAQTAIGTLSGLILKDGVDALVGFGQAALDSVASLEQNVGGVETLFKNSADAVIANANRAFQTAGMSANQYMSTVTSFAASLMQSLGNDTEQATRYADMAITDMSDNANKMGTSMELIQNAYQGFAKQNYTMLDNLKLGYGGTKSEMERLLKTASEIKAAQGEYTEYSIDSYADIVEAIHVVQEEMGITGTTALEAATTIEGSMNSAKAAWDNFLSGSGSAEEFAESFAVAAENILSALIKIGSRMSEAAPKVVTELVKSLSESVSNHRQEIAENGRKVVNDLLDGISEHAPEVVSNGMQLITSWLESMRERLPDITSSAFEFAGTLVAGLSQSLAENGPALVDAGGALIQDLLVGLAENAPQIIIHGMELITSWLSAIKSKIPDVANAAIEIMLTLLEGIVANAPLIISQAAEMTIEFASTIISLVGNVTHAGLEVITQFLSGILSRAGEVPMEAATMVANFIVKIVDSFGEMFASGANIVVNIVSGIQSKVGNVIHQASVIISDFMAQFQNADWISIGWNIIQGIASGVSSAAGNLVNAAAAAVDDALNWVKSKLGIASPSKVFRDEVGRYMAEGIGVGFEENMPVEKMEGQLNNAMKALQKTSISATANIPATTNNLIKNVTNNYLGDYGGIDYDAIEKAQERAMNRANDRPIYLSDRDIRRAMEDEGWALSGD